ncbi:hypothetical protein E2C01_023403 [Portunus trituberculatus]|uniref:Uncharacterized protein n=1 Tax=Portunus trituberculatus TaxID=210409 RepID=A0A5B7EBH3_PORTR|nr:hypothetical protein [Portunus trituberculatus]
MAQSRYGLSPAVILLGKGRFPRFLENELLPGGDNGSDFFSQYIEKPHSVFGAEHRAKGQLDNGVQLAGNGTTHCKDTSIKTASPETGALTKSSLTRSMHVEPTSKAADLTQDSLVREMDGSDVLCEAASLFNR